MRYQVGYAERCHPAPDRRIARGLPRRVGHTL